MSSALVVQRCWGIHSDFPGQGAVAYGVICDAISVYRATCPLSALNPKWMSVHVVCELIGMAAHQVNGGIGLCARKARPCKDVVINAVGPLDVGFKSESVALSTGLSASVLSMLEIALRLACQPSVE